MPEKFVLHVDGMMCQNNCGNTVQNALKSVSGVSSAQVKFESKSAVVEGDCLLNDVINAVLDIGFEAVPIEETEPAHRLLIEGMMCQKNCGTTVQNALRAVPGVIYATVAFSIKEARVWGTASLEDLIEAVECVGFDATPINTLPSQAAPTAPDNTYAVTGLQAENVELLRHNLLLVDGVLAVKINVNANKIDIWGFAESDDIITILNNHNVYLASDKPAPAPITINPHDAVSVYRVTGMTCANCVRSIERNLLKAAGITSVRIALLSGRTEVTHNPTLIQSNEIQTMISQLGYSAEPVQETSSHREVLLTITGMSCASCANKIERAVTAIPGVQSASISALTNKGKFILSPDANVRHVIDTISNLGYEATLAHEENSAENHEIVVWRRLLIFAAIFGLPVMILHLAMSNSMSLMMMMDEPVLCSGGITLNHVVMLALNGPLQIIVGYRFYRGALMSAMHCGFGMDFLVVIGTSITFAYSLLQVIFSCQSHTPSKNVFFETSGMLLLFVTLGKYLESYAKGSTASAMTSLLALQPRNAVLVERMGSTGENEVTREVDSQLLQKDDIVKILPGARLPTDGIVVLGYSHVDESMITGESVPVGKNVGDLVYGSTTNVKGCLYVKVTSIGAESALSQIVQLVESAQMNKAPIQAYADQLASIFTPIVITLATITFFVWYYLATAHLIPDRWVAHEYGDAFLFALLFAISVVVISCPCALGLATPTAIMVGTSVGAVNGILIKGGPPFEVAHRINSLIFDKTGTVTVGKPTLTNEILVDNSISRDRLLQIAAIAEQASEHPLAAAIVKAAQERRIELVSPEDTNITATPGGITCHVSSTNETIHIGNRLHMQAQHITTTSVDSLMWELEVKGKTALCVALNQQIVGILGIADVVKPEARTAVQMLRRIGVDVWMVTGDNRTTAEAIADELDISKDRVVAGAMPGDKVVKVEELQRQGRHVAMVGDGVNDSPALARADLGIAIGAGTHVAIEAADMVLVRNNLHDVLVALDLAKVVFRRIKWNFMWAMLYNVLAIPIAAGALYPYTHTSIKPQYAGLCMALSSISVVCSSLLLHYYKRPVAEEQPSMLDKAKKHMMNIKSKVSKKLNAESYSPVPLRDDEYSELEMGNLHGDEDEI